MTALRAEGCGIALLGDEYEVSVTGLALWVIWHDTHAGDWLTAFTTKGGISFAHQGGCKVFSKEGAFYKFRGATTTLAPEVRQT